MSYYSNLNWREKSSPCISFVTVSQIETKSKSRIKILQQNCLLKKTLLIFMNYKLYRFQLRHFANSSAVQKKVNVMPLAIRIYYLIETWMCSRNDLISVKKNLFRFSETLPVQMMHVHFNCFRTLLTKQFNT